MSKSIKNKYDVVISYVRFSSAIQEQGDSIRRQTSSAKAFCEKHDLTLSNISYSDFGSSAFKGEHLKSDGGLRAFIDALEDDSAGLKFPRGSTLLLLDEWSRFSRLPPMQAQGLVSTIVGMGIDIATCDTGDILSNDAGISEMLTAIIKMNSAFEESDRKSKHLKAVWHGKRQALLNDPLHAKKMTSRCPSWLSLDKSKNEYIAIPEREKIVQLIYKLYLDGLGRSAIAKYLNSREIDTFGDSVKSARKAKIWRESSITKILSEDYGRSTLGELQLFKMVDGKRTPVGSPIKDYYPRVISNSDFYQAQELRESRATVRGRKGNKLTNLFQGIIYCNKCSNSMNIINKGKKSSGKSLVCSAAKVSAGCDYVTWHYETVEQSILAAIRNLDFSLLLNTSQTNDAIGEYKKSLVTTGGELKENKKRIDNLIDAIAEFGINEALNAKLLELEEEKSTLESTLKKINTQLASSRQKKQSKTSVWKMLDEVASYAKDPNLSNEEIYSKRSKLVKFIKQYVKKIVFDDELVPITKELTKMGYGKGTHLRQMSIRVILKNKTEIPILGVSKPQYGLQYLESIVEDRPNHTFKVVTIKNKDTAFSEVREYKASKEAVLVDPEKNLVKATSEEAEILTMPSEQTFIRSKYLMKYFEDQQKERDSTEGFRVIADRQLKANIESGDLGNSDLVMEYIEKTRAEDAKLTKVKPKDKK